MTSAVDDPGRAAPEAPVGAFRRWAITAAVMTVTVMQVLDVTVTNVALPHMQGSLSAGVGVKGDMLPAREASAAR